MMELRQAVPEEFDAVRSFYWSVIGGMQDAPYSPGWEKGVYPEDKYLQENIHDGFLRLGVESGIIIAAMVVNTACNEGYANVSWPTQAGTGEFAVIHILCVHPAYAGRGYAKQLVRHALSLARSNGKKAVRLDVLKGNLPAEKLYEGMGFRYVDTVPMFYEDTGWTDYELYEHFV